jgi:hypothetical protein
MQPCPVCQNTGIDANGYCTTCSTYLGVPQQPQYGAAYPGQPVSAPPPTTPYPYQGQPSSAVPYSSAPASAPGYGQASAPPSYGAPSYAPTSYGAPSYGYPAAPPPAPPKKSYTGPIVAAASVLVVLVAAIVVVLVVKNGKGTPAATSSTSRPKSQGPSDSASASSSALADCVVGEWKVTSENLTWDFPGYDNVPLDLTGDTPYKVTVKSDGTAVEDFEAYSDETDYLGTYSGHLFQLAFDGTLTYDYSITGSKMATTGSVTAGRYGLWIDKDEKTLESNDFKDATWTVTCTSTSMTRTLSNDTQRLTRL